MLKQKLHLMIFMVGKRAVQRDQHNGNQFIRSSTEVSRPFGKHSFTWQFPECIRIEFRPFESFSAFRFAAVAATRCSTRHDGTKDNMLNSFGTCESADCRRKTKSIQSKMHIRRTEFDFDFEFIDMQFIPRTRWRSMSRSKTSDYFERHFEWVEFSVFRSQRHCFRLKPFFCVCVCCFIADHVHFHRIEHNIACVHQALFNTSSIDSLRHAQIAHSF